MNVVYFDGVCNLCNAAVNFLIDQDKDARLKFTSLQSEAGQAMLRRYNLPADAYESFVFQRGPTIFQKSEAALEVLATLGGGWRLLYAFKVLPRAWRDWLYSKVASNRYRWFGQRSECRLPAPELRERFL